MKNELKNKVEALKIKLNEIKAAKKSEVLKNDSEIDIEYYFGEAESFDELRDNIDNGGGFDIDIIYYSNAMEYLSKNDPSLSESLNLAAEMGFTPENINSELLASLLATQEARNDFENLENDFNNYFEEIEEINNKIERLEEIEEEIEDAEHPKYLEDLQTEIEEIEENI